MPREPFKLGDTLVAPGTRKTISVPVSVMSDHTPVTLSVQVIHGRLPGPTIFVSAAVHGDEIIGVEIVRRILKAPSLKSLRGTVLAVPIVNSFGFMNRSRYLPDRRDLNRSFPGSKKGSLAARLAYIFMKEIVSKCDVGIDLHSAAIHRQNLPQIRVSPHKPETMELAKAFGAPLILTSPLREGSLRQAGKDHNVDILLYEAGEGLRFDEFAVRAGVKGILRVMHKLGMISKKGIALAKTDSILAKASAWVRAPAGGLFRIYKSTGEEVAVGDLLGVISDPFGEIETDLRSEVAGLIIGRSNMPVVNEGDGLFHIAKLRAKDDAEATIDSITTQLDGDPLFDEDEII